MLLQQSYPTVCGLQMTTLGLTDSFKSERGKFVQILHTRQSHWITISNIGCQENHVNVFDSMPYSATDTKTVNEICAILCSPARQIILNFPNIQKQKGGNDCGLFSIAYATTLCTGLSPSKVNYDQSKLRKHLYDCIQNNNLSLFPSSRSQRKAKQTSPEIIPIYCTCRKPESGKMAQCDNYLEWYHDSFIKIPDRVEEINWICSFCS